MKQKTYTIQMKNAHLEPFYQALKDGSRPIVQYADHQQYKSLNLEAAMLVLKEFTDAPDSDLTIEQVKKDFAESNDYMSDEVAQKIAVYYNGRRQIYLKLKRLLEDPSFEIEKVEIPEECNCFTTIENDEDFKKSHQIEAWIEVRAE